ncbi:hypothetical protein GGF37_005143, partial [Kickxella alabastrina]
MHASMADDADQFIIKDDDDDGYHNDGGIGPAGRIGRFRSYQNERSGMAYSEDDDDDVEDDGMSVFKGGSSQGSAMDEDVDDDDDDDDSASEIGGNNDFMRDRAADLVEAARQQRSSPVVMSASNGNGNSNGNGGFVDDQGKSSLPLFADCIDDGADSALAFPTGASSIQQYQQQQQQAEFLAASAADDSSKMERRQVVRLSFDGSAHTVAAVDHMDDALLPSYLLALPTLPSPFSTSFSASFPSFSSPTSAAAAADLQFYSVAKPHPSSPSAALPNPPQTNLPCATAASGSAVVCPVVTANTEDSAFSTHSAPVAAATAVAVDSKQLPPAPKVPPHPFAHSMASLPPLPPIPPHPFAAPPQLPKTRPKNPFAEPKGRVQDLYRESKQRSLSSSELDNIVPVDIGSWQPDGTGVDASGSDSAALAVDDPDSDDSSARRGRVGTFAARRQRSRSQSAGVGISRDMVIQAASKGQFPYLDAKTCEFVGQLKSDTVTLGGAAAGGNRDGSSRQRSKTAVASGGGVAVRSSSSGTSGQSGSAPSSATSSPVVKPATHMRESSGVSTATGSASLMHPNGLPQSSLRYIPMDELSDSSDEGLPATAADVVCGSEEVMELGSMRIGSDAVNRVVPKGMSGGAMSTSAGNGNGNGTTSSAFSKISLMPTPPPSFTFKSLSAAVPARQQHHQTM